MFFDWFKITKQSLIQNIKTNRRFLKHDSESKFFKKQSSQRKVLTIIMHLGKSAIKGCDSLPL